MERTCNWCNKVFTPPATKGRRDECCSDGCKREHKLFYYSEYCESDEWKARRKAIRDSENGVDAMTEEEKPNIEKKRRGRPRGSKNKPKKAVAV